MSVWTDTIKAFGYKFGKAVSKPRGKKASAPRGGGQSTGGGYKADAGKVSKVKKKKK